MKAIILLAVVGLCRAGGIPVQSDYSISTHGPDRSFSLVHKSRLPEIVTGHDKMLLTNARAFDLGLDDKRAFIADVSLAASPLMARTWTPKAAYADPRMDVALAKGLAGCIGCEAPTVSTVVTRTVHKPVHSIEKPFIGLEKVMLADKLEKEIAEKALVDSILARKVMAEPMGVRLEKDLTDKLITEKLIADRVWADRLAIAAPLEAARKAVLTEPRHLRWMADKAVMDARTFRLDPWMHDKTLLAPKMVATFADKDLHDARAFAFAKKDLIDARALTFANKDLIDARALAFANKDLIDARPLAFAHKDLFDARTLAFADKDLLGIKTMLIKK